MEDLSSKLISAFLADPGRATGLHWERGKGKELWRTGQDINGQQHYNGRPDAIVIKEGRTVPQIFSNGNTGFLKGDFWKFFEALWNIPDTTEIAHRLADIYGIEIPSTPEQKEAYEKKKAVENKMQLAARFLTDALNAPEGAGTRAYLAERGLQPTKRLGAYNATIKANLRSYLIETTQEPATAIDEFLGAALPMIPNDYQLVIPCYSYGKCTGFVGRLTASQKTYTDKNGREIEKPKYKNSTSEVFKKGGYLTEVKPGLPFIVVEGYLDAERLKQEGLAEWYNIFAFGTMGLTGVNAKDAEADQVKTMLRYGAEELILIPDYEHEGHDINNPIRTQFTAETIGKLHPFLKARHDAEGFISLRIADLCDNVSEKQDADSFIQQYGVSAFIDRLDNAKNYYEWEIGQAIEHLTGAKLAEEAERIYRSIPNATDRNILRRSIQKGTYGQSLAEVGFNSRVMNAIDNNTDAETYRAKIEAFAIDAQALQTADNKEEAFEVLMAKAARIRAGKEDGGFMADLNATFSQMEEQQRDIPEPLQTRWQMYRYNDGETKEYRRIEFDANEVNFICAPTSHGKTRILIQMALDFITDNREPVLFVSLEQGAATLHQLALKAYIGDDWDKYGNVNPSQEHRQSLNDRSEEMPEGAQLMIWEKRREYGRNIFPYLKFVKAKQDIDTICTNIREAIEGWRDNGHNPQCVMIDHAQLLSADAKAHSRTDEVSSICDALNGLAKDMHIAVIVASQFNREALKNAIKGTDGGFETIDTYNISQSSAIENIASYVYLAFNTNYLDGPKEKNGEKLVHEQVLPTIGKRTYRCTKANTDGKAEVRKNMMYIECLKGRYSGKGHYCLLPFRADTGHIGNAEQ